ncbi:MAG: hypothetical protein NTY30_00985 [Candidatus Berkelbacteria bacterium]|nr:hypothetical protein [Candidatus Berkelbacteria bacterium]
MKKELKTLVNIVKTGSREEVKKAQKEIEDFTHWRGKKDRNSRDESFRIFLGEIKKFEQIPDIDHQCYFISSLKWAFFTLGSKHFDEFSKFVLGCIQHPSGKIRQSILKASDWLIMSFHTSLIFDLPKNSTNEQKEEINRDQLKFCQFVDKVGELSEQYFLPKYGRIKYISSLPVSEYKSIQMLLTEVLLRSNGYERIYDDYLRKINQDDAVADAETILTEIKLKYFQHDIDGKKLTYPDAVCSICNKKDIAIGATRNVFLNKPEFVCEDCAIIEYQTRYGFLSKEAATAHRRRIFDIQYLLHEMVIDEYLADNNIDDYEKIDTEIMGFLQELSQNIYNEKLSKAEKIVLENEQDQDVVESKIRILLSITLDNQQESIGRRLSRSQCCRPK